VSFDHILFLLPTLFCLRLCSTSNSPSTPRPPSSTCSSPPLFAFQVESLVPPPLFTGSRVPMCLYFSFVSPSPVSQIMICLFPSIGISFFFPLTYLLIVVNTLLCHLVLEKGPFFCLNGRMSPFSVWEIFPESLLYSWIPPFQTPPRPSCIL